MSKIEFSFRHKLAVDIGSYKIRLSKYKEDEIFEDFNVAVIKNDRIEAIGQQAIGLTPELASSNLTTVWPVREGVIKDYLITLLILRYYRRKLLKKRWLLPSQVIASVPYISSEIEKKAYWDVLNAEFGKQTQIIDEIVVAGIGAGLDVLGDNLKFMLQIGAGVSTVSCLGLGQELHTQHIRLAGNWLDISIQRYLYERCKIRVSLHSCRKIKHTIGTLTETELDKIWEGYVFDSEGKEHYLQLTALELKPVLEKGLRPIVEEIRWFLQCVSRDIIWRLENFEQLHFLLKYMPENIDDVVKQEGFVLGGGSAHLPGLADWLSSQLNVSIRNVINPDQVVILGVKSLLPDYSKFSNAIKKLHHEMRR